MKAIPLPLEYRLAHSYWPDPIFRRSLWVSATLGVLALTVILIAPVRHVSVTRVDQVPERLAQLLVKPKPPPPIALPEIAARPADTVKPVEPPAPAPTPREPAPARAGRRTPPPAGEPAATDQGSAGAAAAREALGSLSGGVDKSLSALSGSLKDTPGAGAAAGETPPKKRYSLAARGTGEVGGGGATASGGPVSLVSIGDVSGVAAAAGGGSGPTGGSGAPGGRRRGGASGAAAGGGEGSAVSGRSNASILATIRRYAAGVEFCYDTELKRDATLRGKLVVFIQVDAAGAVVRVRVVQDSVGSERLQQCVLDQIRGWKFGAVENGEAEFQAPFVFTPPVE